MKSPRRSTLGKKGYDIFTAERFFSKFGKFVSLTNKVEDVQNKLPLCIKLKL